MGRLGKCNESLLSNQCFERPSFCREEPATINGGVLMVHAGWNGENQPDGVRRDLRAIRPIGRMRGGRDLRGNNGPR